MYVGKLGVHGVIWAAEKWLKKYLKFGISFTNVDLNDLIKIWIINNLKWISCEKHRWEKVCGGNYLKI